MAMRDPQAESCLGSWKGSCMTMNKRIEATDRKLTAEGRELIRIRSGASIGRVRPKVLALVPISTGSRLGKAFNR